MASSALWVLMAKFASSQVSDEFATMQISDETPLLQRITDADPTEENENLLQIVQSSEHPAGPAEENENLLQVVQSSEEASAIAAPWDYDTEFTQEDFEVFAGTYQVTRNGQVMDHLCTISCSGGFDLPGVITGQLKKKDAPKHCASFRDRLTFAYVEDSSNGVVECVMQQMSGLFDIIYGAGKFGGFVKYERQTTTDCSPPTTTMTTTINVFAGIAGTYTVESRAGKKDLGEATIGCDGDFASPLTPIDAVTGTVVVSKEKVREMCTGWMDRLAFAYVEDTVNNVLECFAKDGREGDITATYHGITKDRKLFKGFVKYQFTRAADCSAPGN